MDSLKSKNKHVQQWDATNMNNDLKPIANEIPNPEAILTKGEQSIPANDANKRYMSINISPFLNLAKRNLQGKERTKYYPKRNQTF